MGGFGNPTWVALANPVFRSLWIANLVSGIGTAMHNTAAVWTMATLSTSPTLVTLMQTMTALPLFLLALPSGALADIVDRRKQLLAAQAFSLAVAMTLAGLTWGGQLTPNLLLLMTLLLGIGTAFTMPPWQALMPEIVPRDHVVSAVTLGGIAMNSSRAIGPVIGGLLVAATGPAPVFILNALSFFAIMAVLWKWRPEARARSKHPERMAGAIAAAIRFTRHSTLIRAILARNAGFVFFGIAPVALLPIRLKELHFKAVDFGVLLGCYGVGGILCALFILPRLRSSFTPDRIVFITTFLSAGCAGLLGILENRPAIMLVMFIAGAAWLMGMSSFSVAGQSTYPTWVRARSSAIQLLTTQAALGIGAAVWGQVTSSYSTQTALFVAAAGLIATTILNFILPISATVNLDLTPSSHWGGHSLVVEPSPEDGPVLITVEYDLDSNDVESFRSAIRNLRRIRLRDGATRWILSESLDTPCRFRESFLVSSWGEHLRQHERATAEDRRIEDAVIRFHRGAKAPIVSHYLVVER